jgi:hypothetical protein
MPLEFRTRNQTRELSARLDFRGGEMRIGPFPSSQFADQIIVWLKLNGQHPGF